MQRALSALADGTFDLLVVGGGITGAGVAREASLRGLRVALVEQYDFASGTSSRSTKLIHGGLRYLKQLDFKLVAEAVREREILLRMAPHLVEATPFVFPVYRGDPDSLLALRAGLVVYDAFARLQAAVPHRILKPAALLAREPSLRRTDLVGGAVYTDSRTDDARLTLEVLESAARYGATLANYVRVDSLLRGDAGRLRGAGVVDTVGGVRFEIRAEHILAAAGPWADAVRHLDDPGAAPILRLTKGVHVTVRHEQLPVRQCVVIRAADAERRMMFAIPRGNCTYLGTTDTDFLNVGDPLTARVEAEDVDYIVAAANRTFSDARLSQEHVLSTWVGLRPLIRSPRAARPSAVSRDYQLFRSPSGLISVGGGKLTAFRAMAAHIVDEVVPASRSRQFRQASMAAVPGAQGSQPTPADWQRLAQRSATTEAQLREWAGHYGARLPEIVARLPAQASEDPGLDWHRAMTRFAVEQEMAQHLEDVLRRRTGLMLFNPENGRPWLRQLADDMTGLLGWSDERMQHEVADADAAIAAMFDFRGAPLHA